MIVGLYDMDMAIHHHTPFNLELMKYSTYLKENNDIPILCTTFYPQKYGKFIVRKDYQDGIFPNNIIKYDNIIYGGQGFSNNQIYAPLPLEVEKCKPDKTLYNKMELVYGDSKAMAAAFNVMRNAEHIRLSLDGKTIWPGYRNTFNITSKTSTLFFHDIDLDKIIGAREEIDKLIQEVIRKRGICFLAMKYPIIIDKYEDLLYWCSFRSSFMFYNLEFNGPLEDEELYNFVCEQDIIANPSKIEYVVTKKYSDENDFIENGLMKIYNQILFLRMKRAKILLKYEDNFFVDKRWERLIEFFNCFLIATLKVDDQTFLRAMEGDSLYRFAKSIKENTYYGVKDSFLKNEVRDLFRMVGEKNKEVFNAFYLSHRVKLEGGTFINDT